jgi:hypothetical protein
MDPFDSGMDPEGGLLIRLRDALSNSLDEAEN